jgi:hypothetical protein
MSVADECLRFSGFFEAELLIELMLRYWRHPFAYDAEFRNNLLETAAAALQASTTGERLFDGLDPPNVNFVAAIWYAEWNSINHGIGDEQNELAARRQWTEAVRHSLPSCFVNPDLLAG